MLASSQGHDHFDPLLSQTKDYKIVIFCPSPIGLSMQHYGIRVKTGWLGVKIIHSSGSTGLSVDCCFS